MPDKHFLSLSESANFLSHLHNCDISFSFNQEKHTILFELPEKFSAHRFRLPIHLDFPEVTTSRQLSYIIVIIQSGSCAIGFFEGEELKAHKVFKSYMVRMKQGKSQIKYLKTKGKSRAGSRVRLAGTTEFFENINERLSAWFLKYQVERIAFSCSKILLPLFFNSNVPPPFLKNDSRLIKIPRHINQPGFEELQKVGKYMQRGELTSESELHPMLNTMLEKIREN